MNLPRVGGCSSRRPKYPPEGQDEAVALVLQQAETLADDWSKS
jgi:hypothetical protein